jgi:hypothetical protein
MALEKVLIILKDNPNSFTNRNSDITIRKLSLLILKHHPLFGSARICVLQIILRSFPPVKKARLFRFIYLMMQGQETGPWAVPVAGGYTTP